jgi:hypothetical protein
MIKHIFLSVFALVLVLAAPSARATAPDDDAVIGTILEVQGRATVTDRLGSHVAAVNGEIHMKDVVATGPGSHVFILLIDNTEWTLAENSRFKVDDYVFDPDDKDDNKARYSVLQGAFNYVSGLVAKKPNPDVKIATPIGSIGIRGTDFWGGDLDGRYGVFVNEGRVNVTSNAGQMLVNAGLGTFVANRDSKPTNAAAWPQDKLAKIADTVNVKKEAQIQQRIQAIQERQTELRAKLKDAQQQRRQNIQQKIEQKQQQLQNLREQRQNNLNNGSAPAQKNIQNRKAVIQKLKSMRTNK